MLLQVITRPNSLRKAPKIGYDWNNSLVVTYTLTHSLTHSPMPMAPIAAKNLTNRISELASWTNQKCRILTSLWENTSCFWIHALTPNIEMLSYLKSIFFLFSFGLCMVVRLQIKLGLSGITTNWLYRLYYWLLVVHCYWHLSLSLILQAYI